VLSITDLFPFPLIQTDRINEIRCAALDEDLHSGLIMNPDDVRLDIGTIPILV
jgi:hypothetical protein